MTALPPDFATSPEWLPHALDVPSERVLLVRRGADDYRAAGFLDDRALLPATPRMIAGWAEIEAAIPPGARRDAHFIFHIGHVGSTLIARLLGQDPAVLSLREPALLRVLYELLRPGGAWPRATAERRLDLFVALLSRSFAPGQRALVKATSYTSELAPRLVPPSARALLLRVGARSYVENLLAGEASRQELAFLAPARAERLAARTGRAWQAHGLGEQAALAWACEASALEAAAAALGSGRVAWCDFDAFLAAPAEGLREIARFFGAAAAERDAAELAAGPLMRRYSKDLQYEYSPQLRREVMAQSRRDNQADIAAALRWLDGAASAPAIAAALARG